jgi:hypothetical protein
MDTATRGDVLTASVDDMVPEGPPARANPARGIALIATALILGLFVLRQGFETVNGEADAEGASSTATATEEGTDDGGSGAEPVDEGGGAEPPPPEEQEPLSPSELTVRVVNTTSVPGTAANWSCFLDTEYTTVEPTDAAGDRDQRAATVVMFAPELDQEAAQLAQAIGDGVGVEPVPQDPPLGSDGQPLMAEGVQLLVMLGTDQAGAAEPCPEG